MLSSSTTPTEHGKHRWPRRSVGMRNLARQARKGLGDLTQDGSFVEAEGRCACILAPSDLANPYFRGGYGGS